MTHRLNGQIPGILAGTEARHDELDVPQADGSLRRMLVVRFPMEQGGRRLMGGYSMDIQAMVDARSAQQAYARELEAANKELQNFASVAAHDLQEPLRKIQAFGERLALALTGDTPAQARQDLARMLSASRRMRSLIEDLLSYSRVTSQARPFQRVDLAACLAEAWSDLEIQAQACGGQLEAGPLPPALGDPSQLRQLLQNLLSNALKYRRQGLPPRIRVSARAQGGWLTLSVADNGIGFDPAYREKVFELFQRLHGRDEYEGTGLGLAICRKIAERHGGDLQADAQPGAGATFTLRLPHPDPTEGSHP
jgi:signal transduction histidine kinase